jgi:hypothetical protein
VAVLTGGSSREIGTWGRLWLLVLGHGFPRRHVAYALECRWDTLAADGKKYLHGEQGRHMFDSCSWSADATFLRRIKGQRCLNEKIMIEDMRYGPCLRASVTLALFTPSSSPLTCEDTLSILKAKLFCFISCLCDYSFFCVLPSGAGIKNRKNLSGITG